MRVSGSLLSVDLGSLKNAETMAVKINSFKTLFTFSEQNQTFA